MRSVYIILLLFCCQLVSSQNNKNFSLNKQFYVHGDATVIGNNILSKHKKKPFNEDFVINDKIKMRYIDIDDNKNTFSSSQATLNIPKDTKKILSATLYWSAIYSFNKGVKKRVGDNIIYKGDNKRDAVINKIKFKTPNNDYQDIEGKVLFDGFIQSKKADNSPYVCYADVTDILNESQNRNGDYTIANVKATQGYTSGGSAGGWLLHVIYETETDTPKYISTYHGLATIKKEALDIHLKDFKTVANGNVKASITLSALEGDSSLGWDQCFIYNKAKDFFTPLGNKLRSEKNFFNSSITIKEVNFKDRLPYSINNLGFDIVDMDLPNENNEIIPNGATSVTLKLKTKSDRFHLFFASFKTEVDAVFLENKKQDKSTEVQDVTVLKNNVNTSDTQKVTEVTRTPQVTRVAQVTEDINSTEKQVKSKIKIAKNIYIDNLQPGYYIISNVFSKPSYAYRWEELLRNKYYDPKTYINPKNQWHYISVYNSLDESSAILEIEKLMKNEYFKNLWIQKINIGY